MIFLNFNDITAKIPESILSQITDSFDHVLNQAEKQAIALVRDALAGKYDLDTELQKNHDERHQSLVRWITDLVIYFIYNRVPDMQIPERVWKNYDDTRKELELISLGKRQTTLTPAFNNNNRNTYFNYTAKTDRNYSPF